MPITKSSKSFLLLFFKKEVLISLGLSAMIGGMLFFGAIMAPLIFTCLPPSVAGPFIRVVFPFYFGYVAVSAGVAAFGFFLGRRWVCVIVLLLVVAAVLWAWLWLLPDLDALRAAGNTAGFTRGHAVSTWLNGAEFLTAVVLLVVRR